MYEKMKDNYKITFIRGATTATGNSVKEIEDAVQKGLHDGLRTKDILSKGNKEVSTKVMGDAIIAYLQK